MADNAGGHADSGNFFRLLFQVLPSDFRRQ